MFSWKYKITNLYFVIIYFITVKRSPQICNLIDFFVCCRNGRFKFRYGGENTKDGIVKWMNRSVA